MNWYLIIGITLLSIAMFFGGAIFNENYNWDMITSEGINNSDCSNLTLEDTAECLNLELNEWFFYNISNVGKVLTQEQLESQGGVCSHSAEYYTKRGEDLGFYSKKLNFRFKNDSLHAISVIADSTGYCIMDMYNYNCEGLV